MSLTRIYFKFFFTIILGDIIIYIIIFSLKVVENALGTFRSIVLTNNKKLLGAVLNLFIALVWIFATTMVIINIHKNLLKVVAFILGSFVGSYVGCLIEEKLAIGSNMLICVSSKDQTSVSDRLREIGYEVIVIEGMDINDEKNVLLIMTSRKKQELAINIIKRLDKKASIIIDNAYSYNSK